MNKFKVRWQYANRPETIRTEEVEATDESDVRRRLVSRQAQSWARPPITIIKVEAVRDVFRRYR